jgi:adenylate cyclase
MAESMPPEDVVRLLDQIFSTFDGLAETYHLEKIKTIGDAYMVASGLLKSDPQHAENLARMALAMRDEIATLTKTRRFPFELGSTSARLSPESSAAASSSTTSGATR